MGNKNPMMKWWEISVFAPQVIVFRLARFALAGSQPSQDTQQEYQLMWTEKTAAFQEVWVNIFYESMRYQGKMIIISNKSWWYNAHPLTPDNLWKVTQKTQKAGTKALNKSLKPVHKRVVSNAKRLSKKPLG